MILSNHKGPVNMKKKTGRIFAVISAALASVLLLTMLSGCGQRSAAPEPVEPVMNNESAAQTEPAGSTEAEVVIGRQDGERFEEVIVLEGMEETVRYEHVRDDAVGFELDYDYESFTRRRESNRECFISIYDNPDHPENYLEVTYSPLDADTASASVSQALSDEYDIITESFTLDRAGSCIRIDASSARGNGGTPNLLQMVYIIPASEGSRIATAHYGFESAEGFGRRFQYIMNTLEVIDRTGE